MLAANTPPAQAAWGGYANGEIPPGSLTALSWAPDFRVRPESAAGMEALNNAYRAQFGRNIVFSGAYRTYARQETMFKSRYTTTPIAGTSTKTWQGLTWYLRPGEAMAATPGTSNHGWGEAVDFSGGIQLRNSAQHLWTKANAPAYGWLLPAWATTIEPWHFEWQGSSSTTPPPQGEYNYLEALLMAQNVILFFRYQNTIYEANLLAGTYRGIPNQVTLTDRQAMLTTAGIPWGDHAGLAAVSNPAAFGKNIT